MFIANIINYIRGYLIISAEGCFLERFINICARRGILLRDIKRTGSERITAKISVRAFMRIRSIAFKTRTRVKVLARRGVMFWLKRYKSRRFALIALVFAAALFWYATSHVMGIDITGCEKTNPDEIMSGIAEFGVKLGSPLSGIDTDELRNRIMIKYDGIAWAGINVRGSRVYIDIRERLAAAEKIDKDTPCNIVAAKSGEIIEIDAREGQSMVNIGDGVEDGDLLVSGVMDSTSRGARLVHAFGEVYAKTRYEKSTEVALEYDVREDTGNVKNRYTVSIMGLKIPLYISRGAPFEYYDESVSKNEYRPPFEALPSVFVTKDSYKEQTSVKASRSEDEAVDYGVQKLRELLNTELPEGAEVIGTEQEHFMLANGNILVSVKYECRENIAKQVLIDKVDLLSYDVTDNN